MTERPQGQGTERPAASNGPLGQEPVGTTPSAGPAPAPGAGRGAVPAPHSGFGPDFLTDLFRFPLDPGYADAAERRRLDGPRTGWRRGTLRVTSAVTALSIGLLLVVAYRQTLDAEPGRSRARDGLVSQVNERREVTDALQRRADDLRDEVARQRDAALAGNEAARLRDLEATTGLSRVRGDGVVVTVDDAPSAVDAVTGAGKEEDLGRVFDRDLQYIANALWAAGAEAIAINGQRLTAVTTIRSAGRAILVDYRPVTRPYTIAAIGPDGLEREFAASPTARLFQSLVDIYGMSYKLRGVHDVTLKAAREPSLRYAEPITTAAPTPSSPTSRPPGGSPPGRPPGTTPSTNPPGGGP